MSDAGGVPTTSAPPRRPRAIAVLTALTVALGATVATAPATTAAPAASTTTTTVAGKGTMESSEVVLSGAEVPATPSTTEPAAAGTTGWATTVDLLPGTEMVALSWDGARSAAGGTVSLRSRGPEGWTPWTTITPDPSEGGDPGNGRVGTDVVWLGSAGADAAEVRVDLGPLVELEALRMRYQEGPMRTVAAEPEARTATPSAARPAIRPRSDWASGGWRSGTSGCGSAPTVAPRLQHAVVHHTASANSYTAAQVPGILDGMYRYHTGSKGWCDLAYNFVVDKFGTIWQGRSGDVAKPVVGGHAMGFNTGSVGVTLLGQFEPGETPAAAQPTTAMMDATARLLAWKLSLHGLDPRGTTTVTSGGSTRYPAGRSVNLPVINPHSATGYTVCPGANVISRLPALREAVAGYTTTPTTAPPPPPAVSWTPFSSGEDLVWRQFSDFRRDPGTYEERRWWTTNLANGSTNRNALVSALAGEDRVDRYSASVVRLYLAYFGRIPDHAGIRFWWDQMDGGMGIRTVSHRFTGSPEFRSTYGGLSDPEFVRMVYRNVLHREAEPAGVTYWVDQIRSRHQSRGGVMAMFSESAESRDRSRVEVDVILVYEVMLGRAITPESHAKWVDRVPREGLAVLISTIFTSPEYAARVR